MWQTFDKDIDEESCPVCVSMRKRRFSFGRPNLQETLFLHPKSEPMTSTHTHDVPSDQQDCFSVASSHDTYLRMNVPAIMTHTFKLNF